MVGVLNLRIREEAKDLRYEPATDLGDVVKGRAPSFMQDPAAFFERTYLTEKMKSLVIKVLMNLLGLKEVVVGGRTYTVSSNVILLPSEIGGGKTHTMILIYHILQLINSSASAEDVVSKVKILDEDLANFIRENWEKMKTLSPKVVVIDCKYSDLAPSPVNPIEIAGRKISTLWGYLGYELGRYELVKSADERHVAPYADALSKLLDECRAVIMIDEIGRYYDQSGLEPSKISSFLMNLAEMASKYTVKEVSVLISLPYEIKGGGLIDKSSMKYVHSPELVDAINTVLKRPNVEIEPPVNEETDLAEILRRRIFMHSREEFEELANDFVAGELGKEYPDQVKAALDREGFWEKIKKSYPFHPEFLEMLRRLAYKSYLQKTRDAIRITVQSILAIREGLFSWLDDETDLVMPYHFPVFIDEILSDGILRNAPAEYLEFKQILRSNIATPRNLEDVRRMKKDEFYDKIVARPLRNLDEEDRLLGIKLAVIIWLRSLIGLGLPMNLGEFPTTSELVYSVSPTEFDVKGVLGILRSVLPQLVVHGDPESDTARWFFTRIPSVEELVETLKKNVTDDMAKRRLSEVLEEGLKSRLGKKKKGRHPKGYRTESIFDKNCCVAEDPGKVPSDILNSENPALVLFADEVDQEDLLNMLRGRNNLVALAPRVKGIGGTPTLLLPEDVRGLKELSRFEGKTVWEGLLEILRYYTAACSIGEEKLKSLVAVGAGERKEVLASEDLLNLLSEKVESLKEYYYNSLLTLLGRCYRSVYYCRLGKVQVLEGLVLEKDLPIPPIVEDFLRIKGLIPDKFGKDDLLTVMRDQIGLDPDKDHVKVGNIWNFIRTTDKAEVPLITRRMFELAVDELLKTMDYAVRVGDHLLWKPVLRKKGENEPIAFLNELKNKLYAFKADLDEIELIPWREIFDEWQENVLSNVPRGKVLKVLTREGEVLNFEDVLKGFDPQTRIKAGKLFLEDEKYPIEFEVKLPAKLKERKEGVVEFYINVKGLKGEIKVKLSSDRELHIEPKEVKGALPLSGKIKVLPNSAGNYKLKFDIFFENKPLEKREKHIFVEGEWRKELIPAVDAEQAKLSEETRVLSIRADHITGIPDIVSIAKVHGGTAEIHAKVYLPKGDSVELKAKTSDPQVLQIISSVINSLSRVSNEGTLRIEKAKLSLEKELPLQDITKILKNPDVLKLEVKERV